jgi:hypothetical protein
MSENYANLDKTAIAADAVLGTGLIASIVEGTEDYQFVKYVEDSSPEDPGNTYMIFWDYYSEKDRKLFLPITMPKLMDWILTVKQQRAELHGKIAIQNKIKQVLGF